MKKRDDQISGFGMVDLVKFICAILIVSAHYITENADGRVIPLVEYGVSLYVIVVPFFFCCAGYFLFKKIFSNIENPKKDIYCYCKRILIMYVGWSIVYVAFKITTWIRFGVAIKEVGLYFVNALFYSTYKTIWYLPALVIGVLMTYYLINWCGIKKTFVIAVIFYIIGTLGVSYSFLISGNMVLEEILSKYNMVFVSTRNGVFNGFPYVFLGAYIAKNRTEQTNKLRYDFFMTCIFSICFIVEALLIKLKFHSINVNTLFFLLPFTYFFFEFCLDVPLSTNATLKWVRKMSTTVFLCQRLYLSAFPQLFPESGFSIILSGNPYIGWLSVLVASLLTAELLILLARNNKLIAALCG